MYHYLMRRILYILFLFVLLEIPSLAEQAVIHPIDTKESACKANAKTLPEWTYCSLTAANDWSYEVDKYYSLLYKKLTGDAKSALFDDQKYWNMYKNNEYKVIDALQNKDEETKERIIFRANQKRELVKQRAQALRMYYAQTFPDDEQEKIEINDTYRPPTILERGMRLLRF